MKCKKCGRESEASDNFCKNCGEKVNETCKRCWVLKKDNYNCGESSCPGYGLYRILKSKRTKRGGGVDDFKRNIT